MPEMGGEYRETTFEEDYNTYKVLNERLINTIGCIQLEYGQYAEDFAQCNGYRVNPETLELEFSYPDPNQPEAPQVFRKPLTEEVEETKQAIAELALLITQMGGM
ncbi:hypothetical protein [Anoxybacillus flavithermus]|nr:hypothetical protein [Anoxybacillus flavithermus]